ncbi:dipeptidyl aminopeptidase/acylaminoacyl peptidase [Amycolatopsis cihanbeyliensis]|uniref:Dipeptidyl aminopeptidase/acylaminoacyl peptidase n=2 Tax=Amycolatopsis cihanbeyliensis TaxID=1128664 RepID=A0A542DC07_AMYCI|nr:dipeptidyl aminopeptidase/acylaminoacyl peptidase [Amycolatopsis cihanbeyliensis]
MISPHGTWSSPISASAVAEAGGSQQWLGIVGGELWWAESRPTEGGRVTLVRSDGEKVEQLLPAPWNVRNRVHEYGGRPWAATGNIVAFTHWDDQRVYALDLTDRAVRPITPEPPAPHAIRYGDLRRGHEGEIWAVRETSTGPRRTDITRDLVALTSDGREPRALGATHHFLTAPQLSPDGRHAAWLGWDHPAMPWDGTELCVAEVGTDGGFGPHRVLAGGPEVAVCQLEWENADTLLAVLDPDGWWNLHRIGLDGTRTNLAPAAEELGGPLWKLGLQWFAPLGGGRHAVLRSGRLAVLDEHRGTITDAGGTQRRPVWASTLVPFAGGVAGVATGPQQEGAVVVADLDAGTLTELGDPSGRELTGRLAERGYLPVPWEREFTTPDGERVPAYVYPPTSPDHAAPEGELPPYLVHVHGGPTGRNFPVADLDFAYFTSRGIGVVAVNYGGSTGYGRRYRERLREQWGVVDVTDCAAVAEALVAEGVADPNRLAVRGGSAGGFTSAASMTPSPPAAGTYRAGTIKFPILDLTGWTGEGGETHDFESRYLDGLIGPLPETAARYRDRSPLYRTGSLAGPVLFLQGLDDEICPPEQADRFVAALHGSGIPHGYLTFAGEQHGFRKAETIVAALEAELSFYGQVFGFAPPGIPVVDLRT